MKNLVVLDCEVYPNYFLVCFKNIDTDQKVSIEVRGEDNCLTDEQNKKLRSVMCQRTTLSYNGTNYDIPVLLYTLNNKTTSEIYNLSKYIIEENSVSWMTMQRFNLSKPSKWIHYDLMDPSPGIRVSLKLLGGRMHSKRLQDLPYDPHTALNEHQMGEVKDYCFNDLSTTIDLYAHIKDRIKLRIDMSETYGIDFTSMSDQKIAESILRVELEKLNGGKHIYKPKIPQDFTFKYNVPDFIKFESAQLNQTLNMVCNTEFSLDARGSVQLPKELKSAKISIGESVYQLGVGGLHSTEKKQTVEPESNELLEEWDILSDYPNIIVSQGLYPKHLGPNFLNIYKKLLNDRVIAKHNGDKVVNETLKICLNGSFGKLGSKWSILYAPDILLQVTLSGQLYLLMLIEKFENSGIKVVSANTDGVVILLNKRDVVVRDNVISKWEKSTSLVLETAPYKGLYSRDVNNYISTSISGIKSKGAFGESSLMKNPQFLICSHAVKELLSKNVPIKETILKCEDITKFLMVRTVSGGAVWKGNYLGKVVRFYYSTTGETITYAKNGNKVSLSDGARPCMEIGSFPRDIHYERYFEIAKNMLGDIGLTKL